MTSYGSGAFEKHDFGDVQFSQTDDTEKDDSKEKENMNKDDKSDQSFPLDMDNKNRETKVNLEGKDGELDGNESASDSTPLLEKDINKENNSNGTEVRERKKGNS